MNHVLTNRDFLGFSYALLNFSCWFLLLCFALALPLSSHSLPLYSLLIFPITLSYTGLFVHAHDAMHNNLTPSFPKLNRAIGLFFVGCYALFSYPKLMAAHLLHHSDPAGKSDPDFSEDRRFLVWFGVFLGQHTSLWQILGMSLIAQVLHLGFGFTWLNICLFWILPSLLSCLQLFFFGTYLPHRQSGPDSQPATSLYLPHWLSFLACFHFSYHREHHLKPHLPWWKLPEASLK